MLLILISKTENAAFHELLLKVYQDGLSGSKYLDPESIGRIIDGILRIDLVKIKSINPQAVIKEQTFGNLYLIFKIDNGEGHQDLNSVIASHRVKEIIVENSNLLSLKIGKNLNETHYIKLKISNSKIGYIEITQTTQSGYSIRIECELNNASTDVFRIEGSHTKGFRYRNIQTKVLNIDSTDFVIENSSFSIPIFEKPGDLKLHFKQSQIYYNKKLFQTLRPFGISVEGQIQIGEDSYKEIIASLKYLAGLPDSEPFIPDLEKVYAYFDSRKSRLNRILFFYTEYYYNMLFPAIGLVISATIFQLILQNSEFNNNALGLSYAFIPVEFIKEILFKDFKLSFNLCEISWTKVGLALMIVPIYYSLFSFLMAIKKNLGYRKLR